MSSNISGATFAKINDAKKCLKSLSLFRDHKAYTDYSRQDISELRLLSYDEQWRKCYDEGFYDLLLSDYSIVQFRYTSAENFSFVNMPCPYLEFTDYSSFYEQLNPKPIDEADFLYDIFLSSLNTKATNNYIRYDFAPMLYTEGRHPVSHLHFGSLDVRIGTNRIYNPLTFVYFVMRQLYPESWLKLLESTSPPHSQIRNEIRNSLSEIPAERYKNYDKLEPYLM